MTANTPPDNPETFALWREASDMNSRARMGGSFYLVAWLLIWLYLPEPGKILGYGLLASTFFVVIWLSRLLHHLPVKARDHQHLGHGDWLHPEPARFQGI